MSTTVDYALCGERWPARALQAIFEWTVYSVVLWHSLGELVKQGKLDFEQWNLAMLVRVLCVWPQAVFLIPHAVLVTVHFVRQMDSGTR